MEPDWRYLAGLIDGEGTIRIHRDKPANGMRNFSYSATVQCKMTDPEPIAYLFEVAGGHHGQSRIAESGKPVYEWRASARKAEIFLRAILPHLKIQRRIDNAKLCIELMEHKNSLNGSRKLTAEQLAYREDLFRRTHKKHGLPQV